MSRVTDPVSNGKQISSLGGADELACPRSEQFEVTAEHAPSEDDLEAELQSAQAAAIEKGKVFGDSEGYYDVKLTDLLPELSRVRKNLHQRQVGYKKGRRHGAPNWAEWLKYWRAQTGVKLCDKTIKKLLDGFDQITPTPRPKKVRPVMVTPAKARQMGLALLAIREALDNVNEQGTVILKQEDIAVLQRMLPPPEELNRLVSSLPIPEENAAASKVSVVSSAAQPVRSISAERRPEPSPLKPGDGGALAAAVLDKCAPELDAVLGTATLESQAAAIQSMAGEVRKKFHKSGSGRIMIHVHAIPIKPRIPNHPRPIPEPSLFDIAGANT